MKKFLAIAAGATILAGMLAFPACDMGNNEEPGEIPGDYQEIAAPELEDKLSTIDPEKLAGNTSEEGWSFGVKLDCNIKAQTDLTMKAVLPTEPSDSADPQDNNGTSTPSEPEQGDGQAESADDGGLKGNIDLSASYKLQLSSEAISGAGTVTAKGKIERAPEMLNLPSDIDYRLLAYNDARFIYLDLPDNLSDLGVPEEFPDKIKLPLSNFVGDVVGVALNTREGGNQLSILLTKYKIKAYIDETAGLKVKLSADKDTLNAILSDTDIKDNDFVELISQTMTFNTCALDIYFAVDKDGVFEQAGVTVDLDIAVNVPAQLNDDVEVKGTIKLNGSIALKKYSDSVSLPDNLDSYVNIFGPQLPPEEGNPSENNPSEEQTTFAA